MNIEIASDVYICKLNNHPCLLNWQNHHSTGGWYPESERNEGIQHPQWLRLNVLAKKNSARSSGHFQDFEAGCQTTTFFLQFLKDSSKQTSGRSVSSRKAFLTSGLLDSIHFHYQSSRNNICTSVHPGYFMIMTPTSTQVWKLICLNSHTSVKGKYRITVNLNGNPKQQELIDIHHVFHDHVFREHIFQTLSNFIIAATVILNPL